MIDTDTHLIEPADLWTERLPKAWGDDVLHVRWDDKSQQDLWFFGDQPLKSAWQWANWGWTGKGEIHDGSGPTRLSEAHPATYDPKARVAFMDEQGFEMQVLYPNLAGFDWKPFVHHPNPEVAIAHLRAYNDFQLEWVEQFPGRFIPMMVVPYWDVKQTVAEIERLADAGFGGIVTTGAPHEHGQAPLGSRKWDPMWKACEEAGLSVSFHTASGDFRQLMERHEDDDVSGGALVVRDGPHIYLANANHVCDLLMSGIMHRFPTLQFASVESGIGWAPFVLEALDKRFEKNGVAKSHHDAFGDMLPSDYFKRQMSVNFWFEELDQFHIDKLGLRGILFETDFPHPTGYHRPTLDENIELVMGSISEEIRRQILWENPARLYAKALAKQGVNPEYPVPA
ncbi:amidohydrolase family protein [Nocardia sp. NPDC059091]|uniref:amidohydrolase family protein n=1 Tax=Nocardia sp. NPDC059091 TaxID=3346724 RepID=UPI003677F53C